MKTVTSMSSRLIRLLLPLLAVDALQYTLGKSPDPGCLNEPMDASKSDQYGFRVNIQYTLGKK